MKPGWDKTPSGPFHMRAQAAEETSLRGNSPMPADFEEVSTTSHAVGLLDTSFLFKPWTASRLRPPFFGSWNDVPDVLPLPIVPKRRDIDGSYPSSHVREDGLPFTPCSAIR